VAALLLVLEQPPLQEEQSLAPEQPPLQEEQSLAPEQPPLQEALKLAQVVRRPVLVSLPVAE
jgi:hypothetical protein